MGIWQTHCCSKPSKCKRFTCSDFAVTESETQFIIDCCYIGRHEWKTNVLFTKIYMTSAQVKHLFGFHDYETCQKLCEFKEI